MIQCPSYATNREKLYDTIEKEFPLFRTLTDFDKFKFIIKCPTLDTGISLAKYLDESYAQRDSLLAAQTSN